MIQFVVNVGRELSKLNRQELTDCKRIVVKVGTSTLTHNTDHQPDAHGKPDRELAIFITRGRMCSW